ncbi:MAG: UrcA family protein [Steroidobacteraceae bacterium]
MNSRNLSAAHHRALATGLFAAALLAAPLLQASQPEPTRIVHYADLNLEHSAGIETLYQRIRAAAKLVCDKGDARRLDERAALQRCVDEATDAAVATVNRQPLTARHREGRALESRGG